MNIQQTIDDLANTDPQEIARILEETSCSAIGIFALEKPWKYCAISISWRIPRLLYPEPHGDHMFSIVDNGRNHIIISTPKETLFSLSVDGECVEYERLRIRSFVNQAEAEWWCRFQSVLTARSLSPDQEKSHKLIYPWL